MLGISSGAHLWGNSGLCTLIYKELNHAFRVSFYIKSQMFTPYYYNINKNVI